MDLDYKQHLPPDFNNSSRVWIYQSDRIFLISEGMQIEDMLGEFVSTWKSHGDDVTGYGHLFFGQFIVLMADETASGVSGCSTDSSVRLIKEIEKRFNVQLFDRQSLAFIVKDDIQLLPLSQFDHAIENDLLNGNTLYFNNTVLNKKELLEQWIIPIRESWLAKRVNSL